jgi:S1-C subfamily serine protease
MPFLMLLQATVPFDNPRLTPEVLVVREVAPAVVYIESNRRVVVAGFPFEKSGYIVTNFHVVGDDAREITVQFDSDIDPKRYPAELVSAVPADDLALLKIYGERDFPVVRRGTSSDLMLGERVIAIGNPLRQRLTVSAGVVSGLHRDLDVGGADVPLHFRDLIQTDAAINPGNSGGPLLNILGELIGINSAVNLSAENMGFAIPVDRVEEVLRDKLLSPKSSRAWLGFDIDDETSQCITHLTAGGPAEQAGIAIGDKLVAINGERIANADDYRLKRVSILPNQPVRLRVASDGRERDVALRGWDAVDGMLYERLGITVRRVAWGARRRFVAIDKLAAKGPAEQLGLKSGDVIAMVRVAPRGQPYSTATPEDLASLISSLDRGVELEVEILRDEDGDGQIRTNELYRGTLSLQ